MERKGGKHRRIVADGVALKRLRLEKGLTLPEFVRRTGVSKSQLSQIERGISGASDRSAIAIMEVLGCSFGDIFRIETPGDEDKEETPVRQLVLGHV